MAEKKNEFAHEFGKYERNILHAQAVNDVGGRVEYWIHDAEADIERCNENIGNRYASNANNEDWKPEDDWTLRSYEQEMLQYREVLALWKKLDSVLEKELSF